MRQINRHFTFEFAGPKRLYLNQLGRLSVLFTFYEKALRKRAMLDLLRKESPAENYTVKQASCRLWRSSSIMLPAFSRIS